MSTTTSTLEASPTRISPEKAERLRRMARKGLTPPPRISIPEWADRFRKLPRGAGSTSGQWRTSTVEAARGPMLAVTEPGVHVITAMTCTQLLKSSLLESVFGYFAHLDPCPILLVQPKEDAAEQFSKERIQPLISETPVLRKIIGKRKTRDSEDTLVYKAYPGGFLAMVGAGSPDNLARRAIRITLFDEVDKYPANKEGDPISLGEERTATFAANWLSIRACSPTLQDDSRIEASYAEGDQRRASVECPHCGHRLFPDFFSHVDWAKDEDGGHRPETARIYCERCGAGWSEGQRLQALQTIRWHQTRPFSCCGSQHSPLDAYAAAWREDVAAPVGTIWDWWEGPRHQVYRAKCPTCGGWGVDNEHASFQASKLLSPWSKDRPKDLARKWLAAKVHEDLRQTFFNTQLGMPYRPRIGRDIQPNSLLERREVWPGDVPAPVAVLTAGVDTQDNRLEVEVVGWGRDEESWSVHYEVLAGDPDQPDVWERLDELLQKTWLRADGAPFKIAAACIDSGGHHTQAVYRFCRARTGRKVWAIKGASETSAQRMPVWPTSSPNRKRTTDYRPVLVGTQSAKDRISGCLAIDHPGPGYMHFPGDRDIGYFTQLTGERLAVKRSANGSIRRVWEAKRGVAHEALDCRVYAYAALWGLIINHKVDVSKVADRVGAAVEAPVIRAGTPEAQRIEATSQTIVERAPPPKPPPRPRVSTSPWVNS